jgi:hypothetical protein
MTALYWPPEYDCTEASRRLAMPSTVHVHTDDEQAACRALLTLAAEYPQRHEAGQRYHCIRGPHGLLRGVCQ